MVDHFEVVIDLVRWWQACHLGLAAQGCVQIVAFFLYRHFLCRDPIKVDPLVVQAIKVARHIVETLLFLCCVR